MIRSFLHKVGKKGSGAEIGAVSWEVEEIYDLLVCEEEEKQEEEVGRRSADPGRPGAEEDPEEEELNSLSGWTWTCFCLDRRSGNIQVGRRGQRSLLPFLSSKAVYSGFFLFSLSELQKRANPLQVS